MGKDIIIYAISQLVAAINDSRRDLNPVIALTAYDLLVNTNRQTGGGNSDQLQKALERLSGACITTVIHTSGIRKLGIIDN